MRNIKGLFGVVLLLLIGIYIASCTDVARNTTDAGDGYRKAIVQHMGFDFSAGIITGNADAMDGHTINWPPDYSVSTDYPSNSTFFWWGNTMLDTVNNVKSYTKDYGEVAVDSVLTAPTDLAWDVSPNIIPMLKDHVIVAKCHDGYVKMQVLAVGTANIIAAEGVESVKSLLATDNILALEGWSVLVKYKYSSSSSF